MLHNNILPLQIQQDKANQLLNAAANQTALAAIGQRKRPLSDVGGASGSSQAGSSGDGSSSAASLFASLVSKIFGLKFEHVHVVVAEC